MIYKLLSYFIRACVFSNCALLLLLFFSRANAQVTVSHKSGYFYIEKQTDIHIKGSLKSEEHNKDIILNLGNIHVSDSIICHNDTKLFGETPDTVQSNIFLNGDKKQFIEGDTLRFGNLVIQNTFDTVALLGHLQIYNKLQFDEGNLSIAHNSVDLLSRGNLFGESDNKRILMKRFGFIHLSRPLLNGYSYENIAGTGLGMDIIGNLGINTHIWRKHEQIMNVGNGSIARYFYFLPEKAANVRKPVIHYFDPSELLSQNEEELSIFLSQSNGAIWLESGGVVDANANAVEGDSGLEFELSEDTRITLAESVCDSLPPVSFHSDTIVFCEGESAWIAAEGTSGLASSWSTGDQNVDSVAVSVPGLYSVTITNAYGCKNSDSIVVETAPIPVANFTVEPVCTGSVSEFTNLSKIESGNFTSFWNLDDANTVTRDTTSESNPKFVYSGPGIFNVELKVTSEYGCIDAIAKPVKTLPYPQVDFQLEDTCADSTQVFKNLTSVFPRAEIQYQWTFADGTRSNETDPEYHSSVPGSYSVELVASSQGCSSEVTKTVLIHPNPKARFSSDTVCFGNPTAFSNQSTIASGLVDYTWTFEENKQSELKNPEYLFNSPGIYPVKLELESEYGCKHQFESDVIVHKLPEPAFAVEEVCEGDELVVQNNSNSSSNFHWDFNGKSTSTEFSPSITFDEPGEKEIKLVETDLNTCTDSITETVIINPIPHAAFIAEDVCVGEAVHFINTSSVSSGEMTFTWSLGDGNPSSDKSPEYVYEEPGEYKVTVIVDGKACSDTVFQNITIHPLPEVDLGGNIATCGDSVTLDAENAGGNFIWSDLSTQQTLTVKYPGTYWVEVENTFGCVNSDTLDVQLNSPVSPDLGEDTSFCSKTTLDAGYPQSSYLWSTGETTREIEVRSSGTYRVEITDQNNCTGSDEIVIEINNPVKPDLGQDIEKCEGETVRLSSFVEGTAYHWNTGETSPFIEVSETGVYWLDLTDENGCSESDTVWVSIHKNPVADLGGGGQFCDSALLELTYDKLSITWEDGSTDLVRAIKESGLFSVKVDDPETGCSATDTVTIEISASPVIELGQDTVVCPGESVIINTNYPESSNIWNTGLDTPSLTVTETGEYSVLVTTPQGCSGSDSINVTVNKTASTYLGEDFVLCQGATAQLSSPVNNVTYEWFREDIKLAETGQIIEINEPGTYSITVKDSFNCKASDIIHVIESDREINADFLVSTTGIIVGDTIQFINLSHPFPYTSNWNFGDSNLSIDEDPSHIYFDDGTYTVVLEVSNGICKDTLSKDIIVLPPETKKSLNQKSKQPISEVNLYPNPNNGEFTLEVKLTDDLDVHIDIFNLQGQLIFQDKKKGREIDLHFSNANLITGIYLVRLRSYQQQKFIKFIKY